MLYVRYVRDISELPIGSMTGVYWWDPCYSIHGSYGFGNFWESWPTSGEGPLGPWLCSARDWAPKATTWRCLWVSHGAFQGQDGLYIIDYVRIPQRGMTPIHQHWRIFTINTFGSIWDIWRHSIDILSGQQDCGGWRLAQFGVHIWVPLHGQNLNSTWLYVPTINVLFIWMVNTGSLDHCKVPVRDRRVPHTMGRGHAF